MNPTNPDAMYPNDTVVTLEENGVQRLFLIHSPKSYSSEKKYPVVLVLHGGGSNARNVRKLTAFNDKADAEGIIVVYPQGTGDEKLGSFQGSWNNGPIAGGKAFDNNVDDISFLMNVLDYVENNYSVDKNMIYSTGISMGGMMSYHLACEKADRIAAIAPIGAALSTQPCNPSRPISLIHFHGTADKFIPINGGDSDSSLPKVLVVGGGYPSEKESDEVFITRNKCEDQSNLILSKGDTNCFLYSPCLNGSEVEVCISIGAGHAWPGSVDSTKGTILENYLGSPTQDISANDLMWDFFKNHPMQ